MARARYALVLQDFDALPGAIMPAQIVVATAHYPRHLGPMLRSAADLIEEQFGDKPDHWLPDVKEHQPCGCALCETRKKAGRFLMAELERKFAAGEIYGMDS